MESRFTKSARFSKSGVLGQLGRQYYSRQLAVIQELSTFKEKISWVYSESQSMFIDWGFLFFRIWIAR